MTAEYYSSVENRNPHAYIATHIMYNIIFAALFFSFLVVLTTILTNSTILTK